MNCKYCSGNISIVDGVCVCDSCGSKYELHDFFENIDVYISYVENDENGRRTKDSIIAQDVYKNFEAQKISTFFSRISADGLFGEDLEKACIAAINKAKIVVVIGTSEERFNSIDEKYGSFFVNKIVFTKICNFTVWVVNFNQEWLN